MLHAGWNVANYYEICMSKLSKEIKIFKQIYKVTLFVMSKESKVMYTYMNRMLTVASLLSNSNWVNL